MAHNFKIQKYRLDKLLSARGCHFGIGKGNKNGKTSSLFGLAPDEEYHQYFFPAATI